MFSLQGKPVCKKTRRFANLTMTVRGVLVRGYVGRRASLQEMVQRGRAAEKAEKSGAEKSDLRAWLRRSAEASALCINGWRLGRSGMSSTESSRLAQIWRHNQIGGQSYHSPEWIAFIARTHLRSRIPTARMHIILESCKMLTWQTRRSRGE